MKKKNKKVMKSIIIIFLSLVVVGTATVFGVNAHVKGSAEDRIIITEEAAKLPHVDCILVLGCKVKDNGVYRALYIAEQLGLEAYGVASDYHTYAGQPVREMREILARSGND